MAKGRHGDTRSGRLRLAVDMKVPCGPISGGRAYLQPSSLKVQILIGSAKR